MKNNELNAVPMSNRFEEGRALRSSPRESSGQAGQALRTSGQAEARLYEGSTPIMKNKKLLGEHSCDEKKRQPFGAQGEQGCPSATLRVNRTPKLDAESLWKQIEDVVVPQLRLSVIDHVVYIHLVRHSRLEGRRRLRFSILWLARNIHLSGGPTREAVRRLAAQGAVRLIERSKAGHVAEVRLPEEIRGVRARAKRAREAARLSGAMGIGDVDFLKTLELRRAIHARERGRCFYCLRQVPARLASIDHVVPRARVGCNSYRNLVSCCMECNSEKGERPAEEFVRGLYRERSMTAAELKNRLRALDALAAGKLRPTIPSVGGLGSQV
jgi:hypothetical protein